MEGVVVPSYVLQGESAELRCQFTLDQDNLYSVTWYKDHEEFYRYVPKNNPRQHMYKLDGAKVDVRIEKLFSIYFCIKDTIVNLNCIINLKIATEK